MAESPSEITPSLSALAHEIREANAGAERDAQSAIAKGRRAGQLLLQAKASVNHGGWAEWLDENFDFTQQWAAGLMRIAKAEPVQIESARSIRGALKELAAPPAGSSPRLAELEETIGSGLRLAPELMEALDEVEALFADRDSDPKASWDLEEKMGELRERIHASLTPFERFWLKHKGLVGADRLAGIEEVSEIAGMRALVEIVGEDLYCWVGYAPATEDGIGNPLSYHPGWADYCRKRLGDDVNFATEELMPSVSSTGGRGES